ncbi:Aerobic glycerol-3-phosphate dehydrogenase [compost metagenome]
MPISGGSVGGSAGFTEYVVHQTLEGERRGLPRELAEAWTLKYGSNVGRLYELVEDAVREHHPSELPIEVVVPLKYAMIEEMAATPIDFFHRRTGALLFNIAWVREWKSKVSQYMESALGWTEQQKQQYDEELELMLQEASGQDFIQ